MLNAKTVFEIVQVLAPYAGDPWSSVEANKLSQFPVPVGDQLYHSDRVKVYELFGFAKIDEVLVHRNLLSGFGFFSQGSFASV